MQAHLTNVCHRQSSWLEVSRQSSAAKGNMGGRPPMTLASFNHKPDD